MSCACSSGDRIELELMNKVEHNNETYSFDFAYNEALEWIEGDSSKLFVTINGREVGKKFSFASLKEEEMIRFTTRIRENRSDYKEGMNRLSKGDVVTITSPSGEFSLERDHRPVILLSNGVGIATMRGLIKAYEKDQSGIPFLTQINVDATGSIYEEEFKKIETKHHGFTSIYTKHRKDFYTALDYESQNIMFTSGMMPYFYVVGSDSFIVDVTAYVMSVGFDPHDIITDGHSSGGCGCSSSGGCGCGSNELGANPVVKVGNLLTTNGKRSLNNKKRPIYKTSRLAFKTYV